MFRKKYPSSKNDEPSATRVYAGPEQMGAVRPQPDPEEVPDADFEEVYAGPEDMGFSGDGPQEEETDFEDYRAQLQNMQTDPRMFMVTYAGPTPPAGAATGQFMDFNALVNAGEESPSQNTGEGKYCHVCGTKLHEGAKFCHECGAQTVG